MRMWKMKMLMVGVVAVGLAWARPAAAADVLFDPDGAEIGGVAPVTINSFDQSAGNVIALDAVVGNLAVGDSVRLLYQANLANALLGSTVQVTGDGTLSAALGSTPVDFFTFTASFTQVVLANLGGVFIFGIDNTAVNTFTMYANKTGRANDGTGAGFITSTPILSGTILTAPEIFSFQTSTPPCQQVPGVPNCLLDPNNLNTTAAVNPDTLFGFGSVQNMLIDITSADANYFPGFNLTTTFALTASDLGLPFRTVAPTDCFFSNGDADCTDAGEQAGITTVGAVNGFSGPNTMIETDARSSFISAEELVVPEPATMTLLGFGLFGAAAARRRQLRKAAQ